MDGYVDWREESAAVEAAYHTWRGAPPDQRQVAFDDYFAALDREERPPPSIGAWSSRSRSGATRC